MGIGWLSDKFKQRKSAINQKFAAYGELRFIRSKNTIAFAISLAFPKRPAGTLLASEEARF